MQEGKREAFYTLRPTQPLICKQGLLMEKVNSKITILPRHLTFCLRICLDPLPHSPCFVQDVITKIQDVMAPSPRHYGPSQRRHGPSQRALISPLIGHIFCTRRNHPNPRVPVGS
jgi:hypothetical protein